VDLSRQTRWSGAHGMATPLQQNPYRCDQCGTGEIVAVPLLHQQGTRSYSGTFSHGTSQSYSAQVAAPPRPRSYLRPVILWGFAILLFFFWSYAGLGAIFEHPTTTAMKGSVVAVFILLCVVCVVGLLASLRRIARYNREIYPQLHWDWTHTYMCRRCGKSSLIPS